mmetsp:Transcript_36754/g.84851  ORF Transcript_36754/g.84851 Transcript_36754/m.84851 type:complete len:526 (+) Transcript_36754:89-1666(+)
MPASGIPSATAAQAARRRQGVGISPGPKASAPSKLQTDLTVKLRAMDLALEEIDHARHHDSQVGERGHRDHAHSLARLVEDCLARTTKQMETLENDLRSHVSSEITSLSQQGLDKQFTSEQQLAEFQIELTSALEQRLGDADDLLGRRVEDVRAELQRGISSFEESTQQTRARVAELGDSTKQWCDRIEAFATRADSRISDQSQALHTTVEDLKSQLVSIKSDLYSQIQGLQEEICFATEQLHACRVRIQELQGSRDELGMEYSLLSQRLQLLQEEVFTITPDLERRNHKLESILIQTREAQSESLTEVGRTLANGSPQVAGKDHAALCQRLEDLETCWPGSLQTERLRLDEVRRGIEVQLAMARDRIETLEVKCAQQAREVESRCREAMQEVREHLSMKHELAWRQIAIQTEGVSGLTPRQEVIGASVDAEQGQSAELRQFREAAEERFRQLERRQTEWRSEWEECKSTFVQLDAAPWTRAISSLEFELKSLLAGQVEDSAAALRSVAQMVEAGGGKLCSMPES